MTAYFKYSDEIPDAREIERIVAGYPDAQQLIAIIARSYEYIQKLPLRGLCEDYSRNNPEMFDYGH